MCLLQVSVWIFLLLFLTHQLVAFFGGEDSATFEEASLATFSLRKRRLTMDRELLRMALDAMREE